MEYFFFLSSLFSVPDAAQEILRLQALVKKQGEELAMREAEWRMRNLPPNVGDMTGGTTQTSLLDQMDTSQVQRVADDLLSRSGAGGAGAGVGDGQHQGQTQPPAGDVA